LRFGSFTTATIAFGARAMEIVRGRYPQVELRFAEGEPHESVARLRQRELDLAVLFDMDHRTAATDDDGHTVDDDRDIECVELFEDPYYVALTRGHPLAASQALELRDLDGQRVVGGPPECSPWGRDLRERCARAQVEPRFEPSYRATDLGALQAIVAIGDGITLVPQLALSALNPGVAALALRDGPVRHVRLATLAGVTPSAACQAMVSVINELTAAWRGPHSTVLAIAGR